MLEERGDQRDHACGCDGRGTIAPKRGASCQLTANGYDIRQRLVEITHLRPHVLQSLGTLRCKVYGPAMRIQVAPPGSPRLENGSFARPRPWPDRLPTSHGACAPSYNHELPSPRQNT